MSGFAAALARKFCFAGPHGTTVLDSAESDVTTEVAKPAADEQIHSLVQQLFFRSPGPQLRHIAFAESEEAKVFDLCWSVAKVMSEEADHSVALIDAAPEVASHPEKLEHLPQLCQGTQSRVEVISAHNWLRADQNISAVNLERFRELIAAFDFSIVCCGSVSLSAARIARACDGLVLVLAANRTRRLVAAKIKEELQMAGVSLLGTVLAGRRFPVPPGLYGRL